MMHQLNCWVAYEKDMSAFNNNNNNNNLRLTVVKTHCSTLHMVYDIFVVTVCHAGQQWHDTHTLTRRTATTRFSPEGIGLISILSQLVERKICKIIIKSSTHCHILLKFGRLVHYGPAEGAERSKSTSWSHPRWQTASKLETVKSV